MKKEEQETLKKAIFEGDAETCKNILENTNPLEGECTINDEVGNPGPGRSLLTFSTLHRDTSILKILLKYGADPNALDGAALHPPTCYPYYPESLRLLCDAGADVNINGLYEKDRSLLAQAIGEGSVNSKKGEIMDILLKAGANPNETIKEEDLVKSYRFKQKVHEITPLLIYSIKNTTLWASDRDGQTTDDIREDLVVKKLIDAGADVNAECEFFDDSMNPCHTTALYKAMMYVHNENIDQVRKGISLVCQLLKVGADPNIPTHDSDTALKLAIRLKKPELIKSMCSVLFEQESLMSLYIIVTLSLESLKSYDQIDDTLLQYYQKDDWSCSLDKRLQKHVDQFRSKMIKDEKKVQKVFKDFINIPYKLHKSLKTIQEQFPDALDLLSKQLPQSCHDSLSSMIKTYSEKYSQSSSDQIPQATPSKPSIAGEVKASVISFLPPEKQWDAIMLSKVGLEDLWLPPQPVQLVCEQDIVGEMPINCNIM